VTASDGEGFFTGQSGRPNVEFAVARASGRAGIGSQTCWCAKESVESAAICGEDETDPK
jgi:hypothetical protein